jgi:hypothetical protein
LEGLLRPPFQPQSSGGSGLLQPAVRCAACAACAGATFDLFDAVKLSGSIDLEALDGTMAQNVQI